MKKPASLHILKSINVESPCHESWETMQGEAKQRFCARCAHSVSNLSEMTAEEAADLISSAGNGKRLCVRYNCGPNGAVQFKATQLKTNSYFKRAALLLIGIFASLRFTSGVQAQNIKQGEIAAPPIEQRQIVGKLQMPQPSPTLTPQPSPTPEVTMGQMSPIIYGKADEGQKTPQK